MQADMDLSFSVMLLVYETPHRDFSVFVEVQLK